MSSYRLGPHVPPRSWRPAVGALVAVIGMALAVSNLPLASSRDAGVVGSNRVGTPVLSGASGNVTLTETGVDPAKVSFSSSETGSVPCAREGWYLEDASAAAGPWTVNADEEGNATEVNWSAAGTFAGGYTLFWQAEVVYECSAPPADSNVLEVTFPHSAVLTDRLPTPTTVLLNWTNSASYGGLISFGSYAVTESVQGGPWAMVENLTDVGVLSLTLSGLLPSTIYQFQIVTWDDFCTTCSGQDSWIGMLSSAIAFVTDPSFVVAVATSSGTVDVGESVAFTCVASGGTGAFVSYAWDFGDGATAQLANVTHAYSSAGTPTATCAVTDSEGQVAASSISLLVDPAMVVSIVASDSRAAPGSPVALSVEASGGSGSYSSYAWFFGNGSVASGRNVTHAFGQAGVYNVTVLVTDADGAATQANLDVDVSVLGVAGHVSSDSVAAGQVVTFDASGAGGGGPPYTYLWEFGDGTSARGAEVAHTYSSAGSYTVRVSVADPLGATNGTTVATIVVGSAAAASPLGGALWGAPDYVWLAVAVGLVAVIALALVVRHRRIPPAEGDRRAP